MIKDLFRNYPLQIVLFIFLIIFSSISLVNHYNLRTFGWDLGIFNKTLYDYSHFQWNNPTLLLPSTIQNTLGDHFSLLCFFFAPFSLILGSYTLLISQILAILWGGIGIFYLIKKISDSRHIALLASIHFFLVWGIYSALSFDYHDNAVAAMMVPWFIYYVLENKWVPAIIYYIIVLISKENMALWMCFIAFGLALYIFKENRKRNFLFVMSIFSLIYFLLVVKYVIPFFAGENNQYIHFDFSALGQNMKEAIITIFSHPQKTFTLLFENPINDPSLMGIKSELHFITLLSGGFALLVRPQFLIMLLPIYGQKLFNDSFVKWGLFYQYSIEMAPIITIALFVWISSLKMTDLKKQVLSIVFIVLCFAATFSTLDSPKSLYLVPELSRFYNKQHYKQSYDVNHVKKMMKLIPDEASVCAQTNAIPRLAFRNKIYHYPYLGDAEYIFLITAEKNTFPFDEKNYFNNIKSLKENPDWKIFYEDNSVLIFKRQQKKIIQISIIHYSVTLKDKMKYYLKKNLPYFVVFLIAILILEVMLNIAGWKGKNIIASDVKVFYGYLPSTFIYDDYTLKFIDPTNEDFKRIFWYNTAPNGGRLFKTTIGMSILYAPFFFAAHIYAKNHDIEPSGYTPPYHFAIMMSSLLFSIIGLIFLARLLLLFFNPYVTSWVMLIIYFGTNLFYYCALQPAMAHAYSFSLIIMFLFYTIKWHEQPRFFLSLTLGILIGFISLIRPINIVFCLFFILWDIKSFRDVKIKFIFFLKNYWAVIVVVFFCFLVWVPQLLYWKNITGHFLFYSYGKEHFFFNHPKIFKGLFSYRNGWLVYSPSMFLAVFGIATLWKQKKSFFLPILMILIFYLYLVYSWWCWWYGGCFGARPMVDIYGLLAIPTGFFISYTLKQKAIWRWCALVISGLFLIIGIFHTIKFHYGSIHYDSMTESAFWDSYFEIKPSSKFKDLLEEPDYDKALIGLDDEELKATK